jgi:hypothetical protein
MQIFTKTRTIVAASAVVLSAIGLGSIGLATTAAGAGPSRTVPGQVRELPKTHFAPGTYNLFLNGEVSGTITFNSDNTWTMSDYVNTGSWEVLGKTISLGDVGSYAYDDTDFPSGAVLSATIGKTGLGTKKKPGLATYGNVDGGGSASTFTWYATAT